MIRWISSNTFSSLQIIQSESHPNMFNQGPSTKSASGKEGLSVYGLFHRFAYTPQGKLKLKQIFFRPSLDIALIRQRYDFIGVFSQPDNMAALEKITKGLKHVKNIRPVMINLRKGISTGSAKMTGFKATVWASLLAVSGLTYCNVSLLTPRSSLHSTQLISTTRFERFQAPTSCPYGQR